MITGSAIRRFRRADGSRHEVSVRQTAEGDWQVLDTSPAGTRVVETLSGLIEGRPQAEAIARDYAATAPLSLGQAGRAGAERIPARTRADGNGDRLSAAAPQPNR